MHEISIATKILKEAIHAGATKKIVIEVGELTEITKEELQTGFKKIQEDPDLIQEIRKQQKEHEHSHTHEQGHTHEHTHEFDEEELKEQQKQIKDWQIIINEQKSNVKCSCGHEGAAKITDRGHGYCLYACESCGKKPEKILKGGQIRITEIL